MDHLRKGCSSAGTRVAAPRAAAQARTMPMASCRGVDAPLLPACSQASDRSAAVCIMLCFPAT